MPSIVALTNGSPHAWIVINAVVEHFGPITVLTEGREHRWKLARRRLKRHGPFTWAGQIAFVFLQRAIARRSRARVAEIIREHGLDPAPNPRCEVLPVGSVNDPACRELLARLRPDVVFVIGTRIIRAATLEAIQAPLLNLHGGITPKYRGQAGGYWALAQGDAGHAGVTVHLVDAGVDTGDVLYQAPIRPSRRDNFSTYFYLQAAAFRPLALRAIRDALEGTLRPFQPGLPSQLYHHPTLWGYLWTGLSSGVW
ncbi:formyl transferase [Geothrix fermentans]|jgi:folate-dependent phosphoribosylglycinamide formyltransferase PurN|uniref:formyl transferase n=1 Tax=Geothrix fermentans TaxID=44676 RepID=UPI0004254EC9|nr:formyl transferase [Geothrix fermentans]